jgi:hypothetical protein
MNEKRETREFNPRARIAVVIAKSLFGLSFFKIKLMQIKIKKLFTAMLRK